jgi:2-C-methyl-D-erythritol 4-phosphate cytidylyltransferase
MNTAIIVAAGSGTRIDSPTPKQFLEILGKPIILHTLERFEACPAVDEIVVVVSADNIGQITKIAADGGIGKLRRVVSGGRTRAESVRNGFAAADPASVIVCVHDGVRPLVTIDEIEGTIRSAEDNGAACLVAPVTDTIKSIDYGKITATVDRRMLRRALTPQAFRYYVLRDAIENSQSDESITDECMMAEGIGIVVTAVEGSSRNIKITTRDDLVIAEAFLLEEGR